MAKFAKLVWLAAVQLFYFCFSFFSSYYPNKKKKEKRKVQKQFWKGMTKTNVRYVVPETQPS